MWLGDWMWNLDTTLSFQLVAKIGNDIGMTQFQRMYIIRNCQFLPHKKKIKILHNIQFHLRFTSVKALFVYRANIHLALQSSCDRARLALHHSSKNAYAIPL